MDVINSVWPCSITIEMAVYGFKFSPWLTVIFTLPDSPTIRVYSQVTGIMYNNHFGACILEVDYILPPLTLVK